MDRLEASLRLLRKRPALFDDLPSEVTAARVVIPTDSTTDSSFENELSTLQQEVCSDSGSVFRPASFADNMAVKGYDSDFVIRVPAEEDLQQLMHSIRAAFSEAEFFPMEESNSRLAQVKYLDVTYQITLILNRDYEDEHAQFEVYATFLQKWRGISNLVILLKSWCLLSANASAFQLTTKLVMSLAVITCKRYYPIGCNNVDLNITFTAAIEELRRKRPISCVVTKAQLTEKLPWDALKAAAKVQLKYLPEFIPPVKCDKCGRGFSPDEHKIHYPACRKCEKCGADKSTEGEVFTFAMLKQHELSCITCFKCQATKIGGKRFTLSSLKSHEEKCCVCQRCGAGSPESGTLTKAQFEKHEAQCLRCSRCNASTTETGEKFTASTVKQHEKKCIRCKKCGCTKIEGVRFTSESLAEHEQHCCRCEYCFRETDDNGEYFTKTSLKAHEAKCTRCSKCGTRKVDGVRLTIKTLADHERNCCICEYCGTQRDQDGDLFTLASFKTHIKHCAKCPRCGTSKHQGQRFTPQELQEHMAACCKCPYCGMQEDVELKTFTQDSLKEHIKTCMQCKRCQKNKENGAHFDEETLKNHERECLVCQKCGAVAGGSGPEFDVSSLREHERGCLTCWKCQSRATEVSELKYHEKTCAFKCNRCGAAKSKGKRFTQQTYKAHSNTCCRCSRCQATTEPDGTPFTVETHRAHEKSCLRCSHCGASRSRGKKFTLAALQEHEVNCKKT